MSDLTGDSLLAHAKKASSAIYLACDAVVADDVARTLRALVAEVERGRVEHRRLAQHARDSELLDLLARNSTFYSSAIEFDHDFQLAEHLPTLRAALTAALQGQVRGTPAPNPGTSTGAE